MFEAARILMYQGKVSREISLMNGWQEKYGAWTPIAKPFMEARRTQELARCMTFAWSTDMPPKAAATVCLMAIRSETPLADVMREYWKSIADLSGSTASAKIFEAIATI